jgi:alpha-L-rhamnosidase
MTTNTHAMAAIGVLVLCVSSFAAEYSDIQVSYLRCEYLVNPLAVDVPQPRLSWILHSDRRGRRQAAYQVLVASSPEVLAEDQGDIWDSGKVESSEQNQIAFAGAQLNSHQRCFWKVRVWDENANTSAWSEVAEWSMGMLEPEDWKAQWIGHSDDEAEALPLFRKAFTVSKPLRRAIAYVCGLGFHEFHVNGQRAGDAVFEPGWTNYRKTCLYSAYDVTALLRDGDNAAAAMLGNGMYNVTGGRYTKFTGTFGPPKLIAQLVLEFTDGTTTVLGTDETWKTAAGPIAFSCIFGGEDYDARREVPAWNMPEFDDSEWPPAAVVDGPGGKLTSRSGPPIMIMEEFSSIAVTEPNPGVFVYDLGRNFSGIPRLRVEGPRGATVKLIPGELLDEDGLVSQRSSGGPMWFSYTLKGDGVEEWRPQFSYYGFRYVQVEGAVPSASPGSAGHSQTGLPRVQELAGAFTYAAAARVGSFACSNPLVNDIHDLILQAIKSNFQSVLTDCPHREKLGWLEVSHLLAGGIMFNLDAARFYTKVQNDMRDSQTGDGLVPDIAPEYTVFGGGFRDSPEWGSASVINPWHVYQMYGDPSLLETYYDVMKRYVDYLTGTATDHIVSHGLGDWYDVGPKGPGESQLTSKGLTATAMYYHDLTILHHAAERLGKTEEARAWHDRRGKVKAAFNAAFYKPDAHYYDRNSQTANAMPLVLGLVDEDLRARVTASLVSAIRDGNYRVTAGDVGFSYLVHSLTGINEDDIVYKMITQTDGPGYADQLAKGATSLTEAWDANPASSQNHCMLGHAEEWFYRGLGGIQTDPEGPGFRRFILRPEVPEGLEWVKAHHDSIRGRIASHWRVDGNRFTWNITIPPNTSATVYVPAHDAHSVTEGGTAASRADGLVFLRMELGRAVYTAESGQYELISER